MLAKVAVVIYTLRWELACARPPPLPSKNEGRSSAETTQLWAFKTVCNFVLGEVTDFTPVPLILTYAAISALCRPLFVALVYEI